MNEQTTKLIEQLAAKLGTTAEYLWSVLIKQAYVAGVTSIILIVVALAVSVVLFLIHKHFKVLQSKEDARTDIKSYEKNEYEIGVWLPVVLQLFPLGVVVGSGIRAITAFLNPEYWALQEILKHL